MGYDFNKVEKGKDRHYKILATCDGEDCKTRRWVRRSWAVGKIRKDGLQYHCIKCSSRKNVEKARQKKMSQNLLEDYIWLCQQIFESLWDDKSVYYIEKELDFFGSSIAGASIKTTGASARRRAAISSSVIAQLG